MYLRLSEPSDADYVRLSHAPLEQVAPRTIIQFWAFWYWPRYAVDQTWHWQHAD
jgi:hypothetical protein